MAFDTIESSRDLGRPVTFYKFRYGTSSFLYTDATERITVNSQTYEPVPVRYDRIVSSSGQDKQSVGVKMSLNCALGDLVLGDILPWQISLEIGRGHIGESEVILIFQGVVSAIQFNKHLMTIKAETPVMQGKLPGLRRCYQESCPLTLYGPLCGVPRANFTVPTSVTSVNVHTVGLASGWNGTHAKEQFYYGEFVWQVPHGTARATILDIDTGNDTVSLSWTPAGLSVGDAVTVYCGCDKLADTCKNVFNNIANFGGIQTPPSAGATPFNQGGG